MQHFDCDYMEGAHPKILEALVRTNLEKSVGYGTDEYCASARAKILAACGLTSDEGEVHFLVGGTQTNATVIAGLLRPYEGVIAATTGHVALHEAGAIEASGHKVLTIPAVEGKLSAAAVDEYIKAFRADEAWDHMVWPGMVYISQPTEYGTCAASGRFLSLWMVRDWVMLWPHPQRMSPYVIWRVCVMCSTSAAPSAERCLARRW